MPNSMAADQLLSDPSATGCAKTLGEFLDRIQERTLKIGIVGLGYVGLPLTLLFSEDGFRITGLDIDPKKVEKLNQGQSYIHRIEPEQIQMAQKAGFTATTDMAAVAELDAVLICVPTPLYPDHAPNMTYVVSTIESIAPHLRDGQLVVLESTTYPGTTEEIIAVTIERHGRRVLHSAAGGVDRGMALDGIMVAFSPEREDPGNMVTPRREIPKVVGGLDEATTAATCALYGSVFHRTVPMSSPAAAEMTKLLENIYRSVNIALVNQMKMTCIGMGIDIWEVIEAASTKPFGFQPFYPGPGVGGHCIPCDPFYLTWKARKFGLTTPFIEMAGKTNEAMPAWVVDKTETALQKRGKALSGANVLVLGLAYKKDVDDLRESPSLTVIELLERAGSKVFYNDPFFPTVGSGRKYHIERSSTPLENLRQYDVVLILTNHSDYNYEEIVAEAQLVIDTRNATRGIRSDKIVCC
jgi:UDP-N-acetyl-D-glucosamine dehydrogenase